MTTDPSSRALILTRSPSPPPSRPPPSLAVSAQDAVQWQPILHASNQVVLYNPHSHALSVTSASTNSPVALTLRRRPAALTEGSSGVHPCPYCRQDLPEGIHGLPPTQPFRRSDDVGDVGSETFFARTTDREEEFESLDTDPAYHSRASDYFQLLAVANDLSLRTSVPTLIPLKNDVPQLGHRDKEKGRGGSPSPEEYRSEKGAFPTDKMAEGYFKTFFQEECKLGMGASGSVYLCEHVLDGNTLGHFAVKKIAVGESHSYLLKTLKEVRLLERLRHPNIISYHHAWLETSQFSSFGPKIPTLFVLMQWAEGGSLDDFIDVRLGRKPAHVHMHPILTPSARLSDSFPSRPPSPISSTQEDDMDNTPTQSGSNHISSERDGWEKSRRTRTHLAPDSKPEDLHSRSARIRAFRAYQRAPAEEKERMRNEMGDVFAGTRDGNAGPCWVGEGLNSEPRNREWTAVHLLSAEEVHSLFRDVSEGLGFLHSKSILHLDLKPGNVLLTWDEGRLIPRAMLSDFGTSRDMIHSSIKRSGNTGTLEYAAPESLPSPQTGLLQHIDSKADMWSLGMILHKLLFFKLPYRYAAEGDANGDPISRNEEGEKLVMLEREVLSYPGFKFNPALAAKFDARWLPETFLVLLERLLNKTPSMRPACEKIVEAIRNGKFDPIQETQTENLSLARVMNGTPHLTREAESLQESIVSEKLILTLPSPAEVSGSEESLLQSWFNWGVFKLLLDTHQGRRWAEMVMKLIRSLLLIAKVMTLRGVCPDPSTGPRPIVTAFLLALAIGDTVLDHHDWNVPVRRRRSKQRSEDNGVGNRSPVQRLLSRLGTRMLITVGLTILHFAFVSLSFSSSGEGFRRDIWRRACCVPLD